MMIITIMVLLRVFLHVRHFNNDGGGGGGGGGGGDTMMMTFLCRKLMCYLTTL
jgi:hypothetical protein